MLNSTKGEKPCDRKEQGGHTRASDTERQKKSAQNNITPYVKYTLLNGTAVNGTFYIGGRCSN